MNINKVLIARKTTACFIEKIFNFCDSFINHDDLKEILYGERYCKTPLEYKIKNYYDGYMYLLHNACNPLTSDVFNRFYYIIKAEIPDKAFVQEIVSYYFYQHELGTIEKAIDFHLYVREKMTNFDSLDKLVIPLMLFNYCLVSGNIPTIKMPISALIEYMNKLLQYDNGNKEEINLYLLNYVLGSKIYSAKYMKQLKDITSKEVIQQLKNDEKELKDNYRITTLILYGSFGKGKERIDSDIDLIISLDPNLLKEEKMTIINQLEEKYYQVFGRYVDIQEMNYLLTDDFIKEAVNIKIIFKEESK